VRHETSLVKPSDREKSLEVITTMKPKPKKAKGAKMREINHNTLSYGGSPGELVSIRVEAVGTNHMVNYILDGVGPTTLTAGQKLTFNLKNTVGAKTILQLNLEYSADGTYTVAVENVPDCAIDTGMPKLNECVRTFDDFPDGNTLNFSFFVE
jgi:hypothetical protein